MKDREQPVIVGLDIGTTKIVAIAGKKNESGKLEILGYGEVGYNGISSGMVMNIEECVHAIEKVIGKCMETNKGLEIKEVYAGIGGMYIKSMQTHGSRLRTKTDDEITKKDVELLIYDQFKTHVSTKDEIIDVIPQEFIIDNAACVPNPVGMNGLKIGANFHVITSEKVAIHNIKRCIEKAGLHSKDLVLQQLASTVAVTDTEDLEAGVAVVDIGGGTTDIAIYSEGILKHTGVIPYAGMNITDAIRNELGILRTQAEQIKIESGNCIADEVNVIDTITVAGLRGLPAKEIPVRRLADIIQGQVQEILDFVMYHLKQANLEKGLHGGIILTGGGAQLANIVQLASSVTGMNVRIGYTNVRLADGYPEMLDSPKYATCIGLILKGYEKLESGYLQTSNVSHNFIHVEEPIIEQKYEEELPEVSTIPPKEEMPEIMMTDKKRHDGVKGILNNVKWRFIKLFEDEEDEVII